MKQDSSELRLYCIVSKEAVEASKGNRGKMGAQIGHAYVHSFIDAIARFPEKAKSYLESGGFAKICLVAEEKQLHDLHQLYKEKCGVFLTKDAGRTVFPRPMITTLGIGPISADEREEVLAGLKPWI